MCPRNCTLLSIIMFAVLSNITSIHGDDPKTEEIEIQPAWEKGEKVSYEFWKQAHKKKPGRNSVDATFRSKLDLEVMEKNKNGYLVKWLMGKPKLESGNRELAKNPLFEKMLALSAEIPILLEIDSEGTLEGVKNWKEIQTKMEKATDDMFDLLEQNRAATSISQSIKDQTKTLFKTREQVEILSTKEAQLFFMMLGIPLSTSDTLEYEDSLPNPFGLEPLPSKAAISVVSIDRKKGVILLTWKQTIDPQKAFQIIMRSLAKMTGKEVPKITTPSDLIITDDARFVIDINSGWIRQMSHCRTIEAGDYKEVVTFRIKQLTEDK